MADFNIEDTGVAIESPISSPQSSIFGGAFSILASGGGAPERAPSADERFARDLKGFMKNYGVVDFENTDVLRRFSQSFMTEHPEHTSEFGAWVKTKYGLEVAPVATRSVGAMEEERVTWNASDEGVLALQLATQGATDDQGRVDQAKLQAALDEAFYGSKITAARRAETKAKLEDMKVQGETQNQIAKFYWESETQVAIDDASKVYQIVFGLANHVRTNGPVATRQAVPDAQQAMMLESVFGSTIDENEVIAAATMLRDGLRVSFLSRAQAETGNATFPLWDAEFEKNVFGQLDTMISGLTSDFGSTVAITKLYEGRSGQKLLRTLEEEGMLQLYLAAEMAKNAGQSFENVFRVENAEALTKLAQVMGKLASERQSGSPGADTDVSSSVTPEDQETVSRAVADTANRGVFVPEWWSNVQKFDNFKSGVIDARSLFGVFNPKVVPQVLEAVKDEKFRSEFTSWASGDLDRNLTAVQQRNKALPWVRIHIDKSGKLVTTFDRDKVPESVVNTLATKGISVANLTLEELAKITTPTAGMAGKTGEFIKEVKGYNDKVGLWTINFGDMGKDIAMSPTKVADQEGQGYIRGSMEPILTQRDTGKVSHMVREHAYENMEALLEGPLAEASRIFGAALTINDGIAKEGTTREKNTKGSMHFHGAAVDISTAGMSDEDKLRLVDALQAAGFQGLGLGNNIVHADLGGRRSWAYGNAKFAGVPVADLKTQWNSNQTVAGAQVRLDGEVGVNSVDFEDNEGKPTGLLVADITEVTESLPKPPVSSVSSALGVGVPKEDTTPAVVVPSPPTAQAMPKGIKFKTLAEAVKAEAVPKEALEQLEGSGIDPSKIVYFETIAEAESTDLPKGTIVYAEGDFWVTE